MGLNLIEARDEKGVIAGISADGSFSGANGVFPPATRSASASGGAGRQITYVSMLPARGRTFCIRPRRRAELPEPSAVNFRRDSSGRHGAAEERGVVRSQVTHDEILAATRHANPAQLQKSTNTVSLYGSTFAVYRDTATGVDVIVTDRTTNQWSRRRPARSSSPLGAALSRLPGQARRRHAHPAHHHVGANGHEGDRLTAI